MRIYKPEVKVIFRPVYFYPFRFLGRMKSYFIQQNEWRKIKKKFEELNWDKREVWRITQYSGSLKDAEKTLCWEITKNKSMHNRMIKKLIGPGFERNWA